MKKTTKAVLLSALVFPGAGHLFLKKYTTGATLVGAAIISLYYLITKAVENALQIVEEIQSGDIQLNAVAISELISRQSTGTDTLLLDIATVAIIICWLVGIIDSYRIACIRK
jgi:hypothetical protein